MHDFAFPGWTTLAQLVEATASRCLCFIGVDGKLLEIEIFPGGTKDRTPSAAPLPVEMLYCWDLENDSQSRPNAWVVSSVVAVLASV
ncbi:peptidase C45 acyl-coenzyme A:6-aminopenicillanic acid acyl-transferase [Anopheles sinensis]|uniref:Peptidase C45 acyl-coenzyme A:6-aminopenicillanic acid acyl-transferase n=1 Tax=Anopheles sinensis TaxID=74873 RepID=A0A084W1F2_ANOSI|nr:peptidase C45 acyl-coenzyme A:6-aminopenicillanic acid acyl-transferase [Anopheles sinensis]